MIGAAPTPPPLIAHIVFRLDVGGLENGLVNLINRMPVERFRHAIICLTTYTNFRDRIQRQDVPVFALNKPPGHSIGMHFRLWRLLKQLRPAIVHTRNLAALEATLAAAAAGVPVRIHGEHGRDMGDLDGSNSRYQRLRRLFKPFVHRYIALSRDLERYLREQISVPLTEIVQLYNGVDIDLFQPPCTGREPLPCADFASSDAFVIGTVLRMQAVKDPNTLARAFVLLHQMVPRGGRPLRLVMIGDGPLRGEVQKILQQNDLLDVAWLPGERLDVPRLMRGFDVFALSSLGEGVSNTILEAMASGLPVVATAVGGNPELVQKEQTGMLVPAADPQAMAEALLRYYSNESECRRQGRTARGIAEARFSINAMVDGYTSVYEEMIRAKRTGTTK
jgi:sugar transferase (PEP-CTERM/EpsH1 system associated)